MTEASLTADSGTSSSLLRRAQARDPQAWRDLAAIYAPVVYSWARQTGLQEADAADVMQETFRAVVGRLAAFHKERAGDSFRGWLWTITRNKIRDHFRDASGRPQLPGAEDLGDLASVPTQPPESTDGISATETWCVQQLLARAQGEFEPSTWRAFWETVVKDRRPADVAAELQLSLGAVYTAKCRVLKWLRREAADG